MSIIGRFVANAIIAITVMFGVLVTAAALGMLLEGVTEQRQQYDRCLKHAINGYERQQCH